MSELLSTPEVQPSLPSPEVYKELPTEDQAEALRPGEQPPSHDQLETAQQNVEAAIEDNNETSNNPVEQFQKEQEEAAQAPVSTNINRELKNITLAKELSFIRRRLPTNERILSKIIHQPVVRVISESTSKTVSRPSGLLGGGIVAFIGTTAYVIFTHYIGVPYNYSLFIIFFVGGFIIGLILEFIIWAVISRKHRAY